LGGKKFVVVPEKDYRDLKAKAARPFRKPRRVSAQDRGDIAEAKRRAREPSLPYSELRKELGLA
jgi:hypothetical protein